MKTFLLTLITFILVLSTTGFPKDGTKDKISNSYAHKTLDQVAHTYLDINNISTQFYNNGIGDIDPSGNSGCVYPKGSGKTCVFTSGLLWGGFVQGDPQVTVGGTAYRTGLQPGAILANGLADDNTLSKYRIFRVRPDVRPGGPAVDLSAEAANENISAAALRTQFEADWTEWPGNSGAPYKDVNGDDIYDPAVDIPGVPGADMTIWYVANDMNSATSTFLYGAQSMGIEVQTTYWAYSQTGALGNMYFRKYKLINKGFLQNTISNMYVSFFADVDDGDAGDDFVGVDSTLSLQYCYNANAVDAIYNPLPPPAVGFDFFQGPLVKGIAGQDLNRNGVDDAQDYAIFNGKRVGPGYINLPMTAAYYFANGDLNIGDPPQGDIQGSTQFYNFFRGRYGISGAPFIDPTTGQVTTFALNGDPQTRKGWIDGSQLPAGDRRLGSASGPFTLAPGDTQEVVVAEIVAGAQTGVDRLSAVGLLKYYDTQAKLLYNNFFVPLAPPPAPVVNKIELDKQIVLDWGEDPNAISATENYSSNGYTFQGYNVYQLPSATATVDQGVRIAVFDKVDGIMKILDWVYDPNVGAVEKLVRQFGNDLGIKRYLDISSDRIGGAPLVNGNIYYFAVTAYSYNPDPNVIPNNLENPIQIFAVIPHSVDPGTLPIGSLKNIIHSSGSADGKVTVNIIDPTKITNDPYQIFFSQRTEVRNENGDWVPSGLTKINTHYGNKPDTLNGSSIDIAAVFGSQVGTINLNCTLNLASADNDFADGIKIILPAGLTILSIPQFSTNNSATIYPVIQGNNIILGNINHNYSGNGPFAGGETWSIVVRGSLPIAANWTIYDDGSFGGPLDASGITTVTTIGQVSRLAKYWNVKDSTTNQIKLANQSVINGIDIYPRRDDISTNPGIDAAPIIDGFQVNVNVDYASPLNFLSMELSPKTSPTVIKHNPGADLVNLDIVNYTVYSGTISSKAIDNFGIGTNDINELQKDYILKFTGVWDSTVNSTTGQVVHFVKSGGQMATIFRASSLATHPLNPNPGVNAPFLIRIPFEVWSKDDNRQVNLMFREREQLEIANPFYAWDINHREYAILVNSPYDALNAIPGTAGPLNALATWVLVFYGTHYTQGDMVEVDYANPARIGIDEFTFTPHSVTGVKENTIVPLNFNLSQNYPNPFNPSTVINYSIPRAGLVSLKIYDILGREIRTLLNENKTPGNYSVNFNAHGLSSGVYFYRLTMGTYSDVKKLMLLK